MIRTSFAIAIFIVVKTVGASAQTATEIRDGFTQYTDANDLVSQSKQLPSPGRSTGAGNGVLFTAEELIFFAKRKFSSDADRRRLVNIVQSLQAAPGLINRNPPNGYHDDQEGADDYVGLTAAAHILGGDADIISKAILAYGDVHGWFMNNARRDSSLDNSGKRNVSAIFLRFPQYIAHFHWCAGLPADPLSETVWAAVMANGARGDETAGKIALEWLMLQCLPENASLVAKTGAMTWVRNFDHNYSGEIGTVLARYFNNPQHPLARFAPGREDYHFEGLEGKVAEILALLLHEGAQLVIDLRKGSERAVEAAKVATDRGEKEAVAETQRIGREAFSKATDLSRETAGIAAKIGNEAGQKIRQGDDLPVRLVAEAGKDVVHIGTETGSGLVQIGAETGEATVHLGSMAAAGIVKVTATNGGTATVRIAAEGGTVSVDIGKEVQQITAPVGRIVVKVAGPTSATIHIASAPVHVLKAAFRKHH